MGGKENNNDVIQVAAGRLGWGLGEVMMEFSLEERFNE